MENHGLKKQIDKLAFLLEKANEANTDPIGKCEWTDADGNDRCNNFSEFQCQQVSGAWTAGGRCP